MIKELLSISILLCTVLLVTGQTTLIDYGAEWAYYDSANEPATQGGNNWEDVGYNANAWSSGNTHMGYGDNDETTTVNDNTLTLYVRKEFTITDPTQFATLDLALIYDDGAVVYLNGAEVWRVNMPNGAINYNTFASTTSSDNSLATTNIANNLVSGTNVLAVEIHQRSATSSDLSFDFKLTAQIPGAVNVTRGPYLQKASPTSMVVRWRTASATESVIKYGTDFNNLNESVSDSNLKTEHEIEITGLSAATTYFYQISNAAVVLVPKAADVFFKTHPVVGTENPYKFWILGDSGTANNNARAVRDAYYNYIGTIETDGILFLGDNAYNDGTDAQYQNAVFENMYEDKLKNSVAWSTMGNHDGYSADSDTQTGPYYDIFTFPKAGESGGMASGTEAYYSFDYGNIHFIVLDSYESSRTIGGAMYNWALSDIQNTTQKWIVALWHHPPYTKGSHNSDTEGRLIDMRVNFLPMFENNGVDLVLSGHSHSYERSYFLNGHYGSSDTFDTAAHTVGTTGNGDGKTDGDGVYKKYYTDVDGAVYVTAGSSGKISGGDLNHPAMYASLNQLGSCILEVNGDILHLKFIRETGAITDYFTIQKSIPCPELTNTFSVTPSIVSGASQVNAVVKVTELENTSSTGPISVRIPASDRISFTYDSTLTSIGFDSVNNADWSYDGNIGGFYVFSTNDVLADSSSSFGFIFTYDPQNTDGNTALTSVVVPNSGGDCDSSNNVDVEVIYYFGN